MVISGEEARAHSAAALEAGVNLFDTADVYSTGVTAPIIGATRLNHVKEPLASVAIKLTREEVAALEQPHQPHPVLGFEPPKPAKMLK